MISLDFAKREHCGNRDRGDPIKMKNCRICNVLVPKRKDYYPSSCDACQKFFYRYFAKRKQMKCVNGRNHCKIDGHGRRLCHKCRLERCIAVGLARKSTVPRSEIAPLVKDPELYIGSDIESAVKDAAIAFTALHQFQSSPLRSEHMKDNLPSMSELEKINVCVNHLFHNLSSLHSYGSIIAEQKNLSKHDVSLLLPRFTLTAPFFYPIIHSDTDAQFVSVRNSYMPHLSYLFPNADNCVELVNDLARAVHQFTPSFIASVTLMALLFFNEDCSGSKKLEKYRQDLLIAYHLSNCNQRTADDLSAFMAHCTRQLQLIGVNGFHTSFLTMQTFEDIRPFMEKLDCTRLLGSLYQLQ